MNAGAQHPRVTLRPVRPDDVALLFQWRNDHDAVRFSVSGRAVTLDEHEAWLARRLRDPATRLWIAEEDGVAVGQVRLDVDDDTGTVSIAVAAGQRGRGVGSAILQAMQAGVLSTGAVTRLRALVHPDNSVSLRAFTRAGFRRMASADAGFLVFEWP
ncbi:MAG: GNAT family N-acetyltransferase [Candidatus Dormibacteraeota bacterium]|uniref:GNAT family N-acetyltransferase n=1 Tax=Candidatus Aeolococcus gillhamiae TaxID=3127015 RepID=A0A934N6M0_9BACT|nr:GNAT family N-acetyltransferase [Candidatus Dormibacteraeota bacterium]